MKYAEFKNEFKNAPLIVSRDISIPKKQRQAMRNQLSRWRKNGLVIQLKKGIYLLNENDRKIHPSRSFIANQLYSPSYVSLEYALQYYGLIPEKVVSVTSVTARKTRAFENSFGVFVYQHVQPKAFRGFRALKDESGFSFFIAEPEKALVDFIYLNLPSFRPGKPDIFSASYRLQNTEDLKPKKLKEFAGFFQNLKLGKVIDDLCGWIKGEARQ